MDPRLLDEERLGQALVARGLITREEFQLVRSAEPCDDLRAIVSGLIAAGYLTPSQGVRVQHEIPTLIQQQIPGYQLLEKLGKGAEGTVYKALQMSMNRHVAVKILHPRLAGDAAYLKRFHREAHVAARFSSPNVVQAIDVGAAGELRYFVMEYVQGVTIKEALDRGERFSPRESLQILLQIARALEQAHRQKLIHRDIKPANIILTLDGIPKLADLGMAREMTNYDQVQAEKGKTLGTPYYMAPEQIRSAEDIDIRADLYSLGATWFHMLTGRSPFPYTKVAQVLRAHLEEPAVPPQSLNAEIPEAYGRVIQALLAKEPRDRYPSPSELVADLEALEKNRPPRLGVSGPTAVVEEARSESEGGFFARRVGVIWLIAAMWLLALSVVVNLLLWFRQESP